MQAAPPGACLAVCLDTGTLPPCLHTSALPCLLDAACTILQRLVYEDTQGDEVEDLAALLAYVRQQHPEVTAVASGAIASGGQLEQRDVGLSLLNCNLLAPVFCAAPCISTILGMLHSHPLPSVCRARLPQTTSAHVWSACAHAWAWSPWPTSGTSRRQAGGGRALSTAVMNRAACEAVTCHPTATLCRHCCPSAANLSLLSCPDYHALPSTRPDAGGAAAPHDRLQHRRHTGQDCGGRPDAPQALGRPPRLAAGTGAQC